MKKLFLLSTLLFSVAQATPFIELETNQGTILLELDEDNAPATVANFLHYVNNDFYDGTVFHRVINGFMIQGGGYDADLVEKPTYEPIANEAHNGLKNKRGTIAMARTSDPHSATSQFFINLVDNDFLNAGGSDPYGYAVFGQVIEGMDVVDNIGQMPTTARKPFTQPLYLKPLFVGEDVPQQNVIILKAKVIELEAETTDFSDTKTKTLP